MSLLKFNFLQPEDIYEEDYIYKMNDVIKNLYIDDYYFTLEDSMQYNILYKASLKDKIKKNQIKYLIKKYE